MANDTHEQLSEDLDWWIQGRSGEFLAQDDHQEEAGQETPSTGILTGFTIVCEWVGDDGEKWLTYHRKNGQAVWLTRGLHAEALTDL